MQNLHINNVKQLENCLEFLKNNLFIGNCLIAELYRISLTIPNDFIDYLSSPFAKLLIDFSYFENRNLDNYVEQNEEGHQLNVKFICTFSPILKSYAKFIDKFYEFVTNIISFTKNYHNYREHFARFKRLEELELFSLQLLFLFGLLLLLFDFKFPANIRERIFVALYRLKVDFEPRKLDILMNLFRNRREPFETCFQEFGIDNYFLSQIFTFLRFYKNPEQSWLENAPYICLYFDPGHDILNNQFSMMRQIIDKFFADRWILHLHIDFKINLHEKWERFKAANVALTSVNDLNTIPKLAFDHCCELRKISFPTGLLLLEMFDEYRKMLIDFNTKLYWLILHTSADNFTNISSKKIVNLISKEMGTNFLFEMLKNLSQFEFRFEQAAAYLRAQCDKHVNKIKQQIVDNFTQILVFLKSPISTLTFGSSNKRIERMINWLDSMCSNMADFTFNNPSIAQNQHKLNNLNTRLTEMLKIQAVSNLNCQDQQQRIIGQSLLIAQADIKRLECLLSLNDASFIEDLHERTNSNYLFSYINENCPMMEALLREDALSVKFVFTKISNTIPALIYIGRNSKSNEKIKNLCSFYYKMLEQRLRAVIQAIPRAIFEEMVKLDQYLPIDFQSVWVEHNQIREFANLERRRKIAELSYQISRLSLVIANTRIKQLGDVQIQPKALLLDGLRTELNNRIRRILCSSTKINDAKSSRSIFDSLQKHSIQLQLFRKAFLFVCDIVGIREGVQIWACQLQFIVKDALETTFITK